MVAKLRVTLRKSPISYTARARSTVRSLGLHRIGETVEIVDNPTTRGMVQAVQFLVVSESVEEGAGAPAPARAATTRGGPKRRSASTTGRAAAGQEETEA
jgi:large subunit ribosomal protein L30